MTSTISERQKYIINNETIRLLIRDKYTLEGISAILAVLSGYNTLTLRRYRSGGASAVTIVDIEDALESALGDNLAFMWTRDSVIQGLAEFVAADDHELVRAARLRPMQWRRGLWANLKFYEMNQHEFIDILDNRVSGTSDGAASHPAIRFNAQRLIGVPWNWPHKQNDAHGCLNFFLFWMLNQKRVFWSEPDLSLVAAPYATLLHALFHKTNVWTDADFGAWEDTPAIHHSSIMCVAVSLAEQLDYLRQNGNKMSFYTFGRNLDVHASGVESLLGKCVTALQNLDTNESIHPFKRTADSAQLNGLLLQALAKRQILDDQTVENIIINIENELMDPHGIARYRGDKWDGRERRTEFVDGRDEMKWCHPHATIVVILAERYLRTGDPKVLEWATYHFNRALACITPDWYIPEGIRITKESASSDQPIWTPDENKPLAWPQAVTLMAFSAMKACVRKEAELKAASAPLVTA